MSVSIDATDANEIDLRELFAVVWKGRWLVIASALGLAILFGAASFLVKRQYTASVLLSPVSNTQGGGAFGGLGGLASQFGGLASLAGISLTDSTSKTEYVAVLQSEEITQKFIEQNNLLPVLYAKLWDPAKKQWTVSDPKQVPTLWKASQYFKRSIRTVEMDRKTLLYSLTVQWTDAQVAAKWANQLVALTNDHLRTRKVSESERNIAYLKNEVAKTDMVQVQTAIYNVLEAEIKSVMMARGSEEYALRIIDPAVAPEKSSSPKRLLWVAAGLLLGGIGSLTILLLRHSWAAPARK